MVSWVGHRSWCQDPQGCWKQACLKACHRTLSQKQLWAPPIPYLGTAGTSLNRVMRTDMNRKRALAHGSPPPRTPASTSSHQKL